MKKKKEEMRDFLQIMSLDGSRLFGKKKLTAFKDRKLDRRLFSGVLDNSLDSIKLEEVFKKHKDEMPLPFIEEGDCTRAIVSLAFKYTADGMNLSDIREKLYKEGFDVDGVHYVRYKRSAGASRNGRCLFIAEQLYEHMMAWSSCGLSDENVSDQASWQAYISLTLSSIEGKLTLPKKAILIIPDKVSKFKTKAVCVRKDDAEGLSARFEETEIENVIWDGEALLDVSEFERFGYKDKGMMLLRNRFFKTCAFNTNLQKWFSDNGITEIKQLAGYTTARKVLDIKLVITESSLKYLKFMPKGMKLGKAFKAWLDTVYENKSTSTFGIVKTDKPPSNMGGLMAYTNYQLLNTVPIDRVNMLRILYRHFFELKRIRYDGMFLRYQINFLSDTSIKDLETVNAENYRRKVVTDMMRKTPHFEDTEFYSNLRSDVIKHFKNRMKDGRILMRGNYQTILGNPYEFLSAVIDKHYEPKEPMLLGDGQIYTKRFEDDEKLLGSRNPHITMGNLLVARNKYCSEIDRYFNLTQDIVCVNAINSNIQQRLNGCDYDSDSMLITDNQLLGNMTTTFYEMFGVPVCCVSPVGKAEYTSSPVDLARLDRVIAENEIGNIVNLSQFLNCLFWHRMMNKEFPPRELMELYYEICKLAVLSGMEIDKAKRLYDVDKRTVIRKLSKLRDSFKDENGGNLPNFYYWMTGHKEKIRKDNTANLDTPMAYIYDAVENFSMQSLKRKRVPLRDLFELDVSDADTNDSKRKRKIIETVHEAYKAMRQYKIDEDDNDEDNKEISLKERKKIFSECLEVVSKNVVNDHVLHLILNELDSKDKSMVTEAKSMLFACILYEGSGRLLSKVKTPEGYKCVDFKVFTGPKEDMENYFFEDLYDFPHYIIVDGHKPLTKTIKMMLSGDDCYFVDMNGTPVPKKFLKR